MQQCLTVLVQSFSWQTHWIDSGRCFQFYENYFYEPLLIIMHTDITWQPESLHVCRYILNKEIFEYLDMPSLYIIKYLILHELSVTFIFRYFRNIFP